jgi:hypothetical protein
MANSYNLNIVQNINFNIKVIAQNSDLTYINLSGYNTSGYIRASYGNTGVLYNLFVTPDPSYISGILNVSGKYPQTSPIGNFPFDIIGINSDGYEITLLNGICSINPIITY